MIEPHELEVAGYESRPLLCVLHEVEDAVGSAVILPGAASRQNRFGGTPARPDLHFTRALLQSLGLAVLEAWWDAGAAPRDDLDRWLRENAVAASHAAQESHRPVRLLVGRSLGTGGLAALTETDGWTSTPTVWIAPLVRNESVRNALLSRAAPCLVVGGTADEAFDVEFARDLETSGKEIVLLDGANHGLAVEDPIESVRLLAHVLRRMRAFVERAVFGMGPTG